MKRFVITILSLVPLSFFGWSQTISPVKLLENAINYHDPNGNWKTFNDSIHIVMATPKALNRDSKIYINLPQDYFSLTASSKGNTTFYELSNGLCQMAFNGQPIDSLTAKDKGLSCNRAQLYKNYYTYLYGLPMKLEDSSTNINYPVELKKFNGKAYFVLKATYEAVGTDIWYFYFDPQTYAMKAYQFYKTDATGKRIPRSGEIITLDELSVVNGIKMPKIRNWYSNKNGELLGTDTLMN